MAQKYNPDGSYTIRNSDGATKVFPDGKRFYMNVAGQQALQKYYKDNNFIRVQTGSTSRREKYYTGPPKAGGSGWQYRSVSTPTFTYIPSRPFQVQSKPAPAPAPAPAPPPPPRPQPVAAPPPPTIKAPTPTAVAKLTVANRPTTPSGPSMAEQIQSGITKGIDAFKKSEAVRLAKLEQERKAAEEKKRRAEAIAARPNTVEGQQALKITKNIGAQLPGMGGFEGGPLSTIRSKLLNI